LYVCTVESPAIKTVGNSPDFRVGYFAGKAGVETKVINKQRKIAKNSILLFFLLMNNKLTSLPVSFCGLQEKVPHSVNLNLAFNVCYLFNLK
jgi:hypothetical protein